MRLAIVQHRLADDPGDDSAVLARSVELAASEADLVVVPFVPTLPLAGVHDQLLTRPGGAPAIVVDPGPGFFGAVHVVETALGRTAVLSRDACFDRSRWTSLCEQGVDAAILSPGAENDLQVEAAAEVALALSESLAGLVIVAECSGARPGQPGHGGSLVVLLGEVVAEAADETERLTAHVVVPIAQPEPCEPLPELPTILAQRVAHHAGHKLVVDYPADLSGGLPM